MLQERAVRRAISALVKIGVMETPGGRSGGRSARTHYRPIKPGHQCPPFESVNPDNPDRKPGQTKPLNPDTSVLRTRKEPGRNQELAKPSVSRGARKKQNGSSWKPGASLSSTAGRCAIRSRILPARRWQMCC